MSKAWLKYGPDDATHSGQADVSRGRSTAIGIPVGQERPNVSHYRADQVMIFDRPKYTEASSIQHEGVGHSNAPCSLEPQRGESVSAAMASLFTIWQTLTAKRRIG